MTRSLEPGDLAGFKFGVMAPYGGLSIHQFHSEVSMRLQYFAVAGLAVSLCLAASALAQTKPDEAKPDAQATATQQPGSDNPGDQDTGPSTGAQKQHTQAGANFKPPEYGTDWKQGRIRQ
jgi:hypothetical protein